MLTKVQMGILDVFRKNPFRRLTFKELKDKSGQKSQNIVQLAIRAFLEEGIIAKYEVGDVAAYSLDLTKGLALAYLVLMEEAEIANSKKLPKEILGNIKQKIAKTTPFFILLVFGSHAAGKATSKSDLDIALIVDSDRIRKEIAPFLETVKRREILPIDYHIFATAEFMDMLSAESENMGKEIYRKHIIYYGAIQYYQIIGGMFNEKHI